MPKEVSTPIGQLKKLEDWIVSVIKTAMSDGKFVEPQSFNVHSYTPEERQKAIKILTDKYGYDVVLENKNNSLKVPLRTA